MPHAWEFIVRLRATIFVAALAFIALSLPEQFLELYLIDLETFADRVTEWPNVVGFIFAARTIVFSTVVLLGVVFLLWLGSVHLLSLNAPASSAREWKGFLVGCLALLIAIAPLAGLFMGLSNARNEIPRIEQSKPGELSTAITIYMWLVGLVLLFAVAALTLVTFRWRDRAVKAAMYVFGLGGVLIGVAAILAFTAAVILLPTLSLALGSLVTTFIFLGALTFVLTSLARTYQLTGVPVAVIVIALALVFSLLGWNDNHRLQFTDGGKPTSFDEGFLQWLGKRGDREHFERLGKPYPVYIVAAEGGGIYAGYHVASFLARLQETCPNFAQHVFAISSVSGGSLGAAHFAALTNRHVKNAPWSPCSERAVKGELLQAAAGFFRSDFLSPLVAGALFPDLLQRLLPVPLQSLDRARGLERAFASAWSANSKLPNGGNPFEESLQKLWSPEGATPALFLNTTNVQTGARVTFSPLLFEATPTATHVLRAFCTQSLKSVAVPLATAVSLSARFPWVAPAGWLQKDDTWSKECDTPTAQEAVPGRKADVGRPDRLYLVDGGYFENSGLETAIELASRLRALVRKCRERSAASVPSEPPTICPQGLPFDVEIHTIMIFAMDQYLLRMLGDDTELSGSSPGELYSPLKTLLNTRSSRTRAAHVREWLFDESFNLNTDYARYYPIPDSRLPFGIDSFHQVMLDGTKFFLPLGWRLSKRSMVNIAENKEGTSILAFELIRREVMGEDTANLKGRATQ